jgi:bacterioferritin-associated ferredoxin
MKYKCSNEVICRCEEVSREEIIKAIRSGDRTVGDIRKSTRAGMGLCQGKTCGRLVRKIMVEETRALEGELVPPVARPPVRPLPVGIANAALDERCLDQGALSGKKLWACSEESEQLGGINGASRR